MIKFFSAVLGITFASTILTTAMMLVAIGIGWQECLMLELDRGVEEALRLVIPYPTLNSRPLVQAGRGV